MLQDFVRTLYESAVNVPFHVRFPHLCPVCLATLWTFEVLNGSLQSCKMDNFVLKKMILGDMTQRSCPSDIIKEQI